MQNAIPIKVIQGTPNEFNAFMYGAFKHEGTQRFIDNSVNNIFSTTLTDAGKDFFSNTKDLYNQYNGAAAIHLAQAALNKVSNIFIRNDVHTITEIDKLQNAPLLMQRFIMAQPKIREMYHQQRCEGYSDTYLDMEPGKIGEQHYDYRRVMNGIAVDDNGTDKVTIYMDELHPNDRELTLNEQTSVLTTWEHVAMLMSYGDNDPTSPFNSKL